MRAFHSDPAIKERYLDRVRAHRAADELTKGKFWEDGKGCAVGCTIHGSDHERYESELGIPAAIALLEDAIFEGLPNHLAMEWPEQFLQAIAAGADLRLVASQFMIWLLDDAKDGVIRRATNSEQRSAIQAMANLHAKIVRGESVTEESWSTARNDADNAGGAAWCAHWSPVAMVLESVAKTTAWDLAEDMAWEAAIAAAWVKQRDRLLELLRTAPLSQTVEAS